MIVCATLKFFMQKIICSSQKVTNLSVIGKVIHWKIEI